MRNILCMILFAFALRGMAEIPPFYPPLKPQRPMNTTIARTEIDFQLPSGQSVEPGRFQKIRSLNGIWKISPPVASPHPFPETEAPFADPGFDVSKWDEIPVPLNWYRKYPALLDTRSGSYVQGAYRREFELTREELEGRRILLHFEFIGYEATLWLNGRKAGIHHGDFIPWTVDVTDFAKPGRNTLALRVKSDFGPTVGNIPATHGHGSQWAPNNIKGGLWGDVELRFEPPVRFTRLQLIPNLADDSITLHAVVDNTTGKPVETAFTVAVSTALRREPNRLNATGIPRKTVLNPGINELEQNVTLREPVRWSPDNPYLYFATAILESDGEVISARPVRFGFREFRIRDGKFHLNGERIYLFGGNLGSVDFGGYGRTRETERQLMYQKLAGFQARGCNIVRFAHMPVAQQALEVADEIGMMIYDEWCVNYIQQIDTKEFPRRNPVELAHWLERDFNHPSVVMWAGGNEITFGGNPALRREVERQTELIHTLDRQQRPVCAFSGFMGHGAFGDGRLSTDFIDMHNYTGLSSIWSTWSDTFNTYHEKSRALYAERDNPLPMPLIIWECVGFGWGSIIDRDFRIGDVDAYASWVKRPTRSAQPNGVGFIGNIGLAAALDPRNSKLGFNFHGQRIYGHRILELFRQDARIDGFAPWGINPDSDVMPLWNQPVFVGLRTENGLPPRNIFNDRPLQLELFLANSTAKPFPGGELHLTFQVDADNGIAGTPIKVAPAATFEVAAAPVEITIPPGVAGNLQLRLELRCGDEIVSRNFYPIFAGPAQPVPIPRSSRPVYLLDSGNEDDTLETGRLLKDHGVEFQRLASGAVPSGPGIAIVPAASKAKDTGVPQQTRGKLLDWVKNVGGTLLILEQQPGSGEWIDNLSPVAAPNTFVDLVQPAHPVFRGLSQENFDTWNNPNHGYAITTALSPFCRNALAARGAPTGSAGVDSAVIEATVGRGQIFATQLEAVKLRRRDSAAAAYLRNLLAYLLSGERYEQLRPLDPELQQFTAVVAENLETLDLAPYANTVFPCGRESGRQIAAGIPFQLLDPATNNRGNALMVRGVSQPAQPTEVTGIAVNRNFSRLFFLHTADGGSGEAGCYRIHYAGGDSVEFALMPGINIGDRHTPAKPVRGAFGIRPEGETTYIAVWENPRPEETITTIDLLSRNSPLMRDVNFLPGNEPAPILLALTGEKSHSAPVKINRGAPQSGGTSTLKRAKHSTVKVRLPDGTEGEALRITLPDATGNGSPFTIIRFDPAVKLANYRYLTLWVKPESPGTIDLELPERDWKGSFIQSVRLETTDWQRIRVDLDTVGRLDFLRRKLELRGELFLFNGRNRAVDFPRKAIAFLVWGAMLE